MMKEVVSVDLKTNPTVSPAPELTLSLAASLAPKHIVDYGVTELSAFAAKFSETYALLHDHPLNTDILFFGVTYGQICGQSHESRMNRLSDYTYVYKTLLRLHDTYWECLRMSGRNGNGSRKYVYASDVAIKNVSERMKKQAEYLQRCYITNMRTHDTFNMLELAETKAKARKAEMYALIKDVEACAKDLGYKWMFITLTAPGRFHIAPETRKPTEVWDRTLTPKDSARFVQSIWARGSDDFRRDGVNYFGCWSKEPHGSAAVHMHALVFANPQHFDLIEKRIVDASSNAFERIGAEFHQSVAVDIVRQKDDAELAEDYRQAMTEYRSARAAGNSKAKRPKQQKAANPSSYIFKYILKALNDVEAGNGIEFAGAQRAHAKYHRYKRFSFLGIKQCLGKWRMVKALMRKPEYKEDQSAAFSAVRDNNFMQFADLVDDIEFVKEKAGYGKYGDVVERILGVKYAGKIYLTDEYLLGVVMGDDNIVYPDCTVEYL